MRRFRISSMACAILTIPNLVTAQIAADDASNYTTWSAGSNGGYGFNPWVFQPGGGSTNNYGWFLGSSNFNGNAAGPGIDSGSGTAFGLYANSNNTTVARRGLATPMTVGDTFTVDLDTGFIDNGMRDEIALRGAGFAMFTFGFTGGNTNYDISDATGATVSTIGWTDGGVRLAVTQTAPGLYSLLLTRLSDNLTWADAGVFAQSLFVDEFALINNNAGFNSTNDFFANSMTVVPEPTGLALLAVALGATLERRHNRRR